jgi:amidohydrolase
LKEISMTDSPLQQELSEHYRWFHAHPERSYKEVATTARLRGLLTDAGIEILDNPKLETGLVAIIEGTKDTHSHSPVATHTVALRGDIDGLPITEDTGLPYSSQNPGVMHGCGHDFNMTSALGAALYLKAHADTFAGRVKVLFQPAEEVAADKDTPTGAVYVLRSGALDDVETIFGVHDTSSLPVGSIGISAGAVSGAVSKFQIHVQGQGSHAAHPNEGRSPIRAAAHLVDAIETVAGLDVNPATPRAVTVTHIESGSTWNVIPDKAFVEGTVRTLGSQVRDDIHERIAAIVSGIGIAYGLTATLTWEDGSPSVENDAELATRARQAATALGLTAVPSSPSLGGEDFSYYQERVRGLFIHSGVGTDAGAMHSPHFAPDVAGLADTATLLATLATQELARLNDTAE